MRSLLAIAGLLLGCSHYELIAPEHPPIDALGEPPYGMGQICVLRPHSLGALVTFVVRDNGQLVGATRGPSYFCYFIQPGWHHITSHSGNVAAVDLAVAAGGRHYLHQAVRIGPDELTLIDEPQAAAMLQRCEYRLLVEPAADEPVESSPGAAASPVSPGGSPSLNPGPPAPVP